MSLFQAFLLGIVEGLTEFIPVSSTAHLLIGQTILGLPANDAMFSFLVLVQIGTIVSLLIYFWKDLISIVADTLKNLSGLRDFKSLPENAKLGWYIVIATIPALIAGYLLKDTIQALFLKPLVEAAIRLFAAAILLALAEWLTKKDRALRSMNWLDALVIGLFQIIAVFPGASRSGSTISGGMFRSFDRPSAARFAFLMSVPVMLAAGGYQMLDVVHMTGLADFLPVLAVGFITAAIVGWFAVGWLLRYLSGHSLYVFSAYCAVVGVIVLIFHFIF
jgi:undecaprenyl-diphosphatase